MRIDDRLLGKTRGDRAPRLVCLLPARNAEADLPDYFVSVARFADAVVALDDGSTDGTRELLEGNPLVQVVLRNRRRKSYAGWDDSANRNRLLAVAAELAPDWIISLDADERIDAGDGRALRRFVANDALPGCAFGFRHFRMWGRRRYAPGPRWIYRLFAFEPGQRFPDRRLHFNPIPTSIPREVWVKTTIRVQHFAAATESRRLARLAKYGEADPDGRFGTDYGGLSSAPEGDLLAWRARPRGLPVILLVRCGVAARSP